MFLALLLAAPLQAGAVAAVPFPIQQLDVDPTHGVLTLTTRSEDLEGLMFRERVVLTGMPLPGQPIDLDLERVDLERLKFGFQVNGQAAPWLLDDLDLSVWLGRVRGEPHSEVMLSFSRAGTRGWIRNHDVLWHLMPQPGSGGDWRRGFSYLVNEGDLTRLGMSEDRLCTVGNDLPGEVLRPPSGGAPDLPEGALAASSCTGWVCPMAIETDYQLFQIFGDLSAETAYVTTQLAAISSRYQEQIDTTLTFPYVQFYTTSNDPWSTPEQGGSMIDMLYEFVPAWAGNLPAGAQLAHFLSGAPLGGGVANLGVLCDSSQQSTFAVSGNISGNTPFPVQQGPASWDFVVVAHETGHNFNARHTHDYCPPIDECASQSYWGQCQTQTQCTNQGTVMSYCHTCGAGMSNITTYFHPDIVQVMKAHAGSCLDSLEPMDSSGQPVLLAPTAPTGVYVTVSGTPTAGVDLNWRTDGGIFQVIPMTNLLGALWTVDLPAAGCTGTPEWYFSMIDASCGSYESDWYTAEVGVQNIVFSDDFESNGGWTVGSPDDDAGTGIWERVDPLGTAAQPGADHTGAGSLCFVTGQQPPGGDLGSNDVDGGQTTLTSPVLDLSGGDAQISYWRWYSNDTGSTPHTDVFEVDISNDGGQSWHDVETVGPGGAGTSGSWIYHAFTVSDKLAPSANMLVRFIASDEGEGSLVEAALDDFEVYRLSCGTCQPDLGYGGPGTAELSVCGDVLSSGGQADLAVTGLQAGGSAWLGIGLASNPTPIGAGTFVPIPTNYFVGYAADASGEVHQTISGGFSVPASVYVQAVYLDAGLPGLLGFTNAVQIDLLP